MSSADEHQAIEAVARPEKRFRTAEARMARLGGTLLRTEDDAGREVFLLTRWAFTCALPTIEAVEAWIDRLEGLRE